MLANWMLGSGGDSRLWKRIREREGLSYGVWSAVDWNAFEPNSSWTANAIFAPQNRDKVEAGMTEEIARALRDGFTEQEVDAGRKGLLNYRRLGRAQDPRLAAALSRNLYIGRTFAEAQQVDDALAKLTAAQVNEAIRRYLKPEKFVSAVVGDFKD
jgi:zinc protease